MVPDPGDAIVGGLNANVSPSGPDALNVTSEAKVEFPDAVSVTAVVWPLLTLVTVRGPLTVSAGAAGVAGVDGGVVVVMVDFRNALRPSSAPEVGPFPAGLNDCVSGLRWVHKNAAALNIDPKRIVVAGEPSAEIILFDLAAASV